MVKIDYLRCAPRAGVRASLNEHDVQYDLFSEIGKKCRSNLRNSTHTQVVSIRRTFTQVCD